MNTLSRALGLVAGLVLTVGTGSMATTDAPRFASGDDPTPVRLTAEDVNAALRDAANGAMKGILAYSDVELVSIDFNHDPHSATFHMDQTKVMNGTLVRVMSWYDNEWGFSNRMADTAIAMSKVM